MGNQESERIPIAFLVRSGAEFCSNISNFKFTGPDGVEYRWAMRAPGSMCPRVSLFAVSPGPSVLNHGLQLVIADEKETEIAKFYRAGCFSKRKARLEVRPAGMGMLDHIIFTFIYVEQRRRE